MFVKPVCERCDLCLSVLRNVFVSFLLSVLKYSSDHASLMFRVYMTFVAHRTRLWTIWTVHDAYCGLFLGMCFR